MAKLDRSGKVLFMNGASRDLLASMRLSPDALAKILPARPSLPHTGLHFGRDKSSGKWIGRMAGVSLHLILKMLPDGSSAYLFMIDLTPQEEAKAQLAAIRKDGIPWSFDCGAGSRNQHSIGCDSQQQRHDYAINSKNQADPG
jgi:hypothetical protein